jgi:REP element-mobilizing transposase RayT/DNA-binding CsgD family transcriptional regulator
MAGHHHIVNRGVARSDVFSTPKDKEKFLQILCKACKVYDAVVHDYCLMDNHYHLLLETKKENLSLLMRQVNSNYAIYFNKREGRSGHLWQGRFKSWYILNEEYLYTLFRYIEQNPVRAGMAETVGTYPYALAAALKNADAMPPCTHGSLLLRDFSADDLTGFLEMPLSDEETETLERERRKKITVENDTPVQERAISLELHFSGIRTKAERNAAILKAFEDGYTQSAIAVHLGVTPSLVSQVVKNLRFNT